MSLIPLFQDADYGERIFYDTTTGTCFAVVPGVGNVSLGGGGASSFSAFAALPGAGALTLNPPAGTEKIEIAVIDATPSGAASFAVRIGGGGVIQGVGYNGSTYRAGTSSGQAQLSNRFVTPSTVAVGDTLQALVTLKLVDSATNTWLGIIEAAQYAVNIFFYKCLGRVALTGGALTDVEVQFFGANFAGGNYSVKYD